MLQNFVYTIIVGKNYSESHSWSSICELYIWLMTAFQVPVIRRALALAFVFIRSSLTCYWQTFTTRSLNVSCDDYIKTFITLDYWTQRITGEWLCKFDSWWCVRLSSDSREVAWFTPLHGWPLASNFSLGHLATHLLIRSSRWYCLQGFHPAGPPPAEQVVVAPGGTALAYNKVCESIWLDLYALWTNYNDDLATFVAEKNKSHIWMPTSIQLH